MKDAAAAGKTTLDFAIVNKNSTERFCFDAPSREASANQPVLEVLRERDREIGLPRGGRTDHGDQRAARARRPRILLAVLHSSTLRGGSGAQGPDRERALSCRPSCRRPDDVG